MPDAIAVKGSTDSKFKNHPEGQYTAQCVDTIDVGDRVITFTGKPTEVRAKAALVFRTGEKNPETGDLIDVSAEMTISMFETANLRKFLENWRGRTYTQDQLDAGLQLEKLVGHWALISVEEKTSGKGRPYSVIKSIAPLPDAMPRPTFPAYARQEYWAERKLEYASEVKAYRDAVASIPTTGAGFSAPLPPESNDGLPF